MAFIKERIAELKAKIAVGDARDAAVRSLGYIGMGGPGVDERAFNQLAQMRSQYGELSLDEFKRLVRDQYFSLLLDEEAAIAAIPAMLPADDAARTKILDDIRRIAVAAGDMKEERQKRLARIEALFALTPKSTATKGRMTAKQS
jgi:hypothetical protein